MAMCRTGCVMFSQPEGSPTCACAAGTQPCTVLDPFCGSGTTLLVAQRAGSSAAGIDLSYPYLRDIARERLGFADLARWEGRHGHAPSAVSYGDLPLWRTRRCLKAAPPACAWS